MASSVGSKSADDPPRLAMERRPIARADRALLWLVVPALLHLGVVVSIARQPLHPTPASERSVIWALHSDSVHRMGPAADFFAVVHAGHAVERGQSPYLTFERPRETPYFYPFRYLPVVAHSLGRAATWVSPRVAWWSWIVVVEILLVTLVWQIARRAGDPALAVGAAAVLLLSSPYFLELYMGQFTFVSVGLLVLALLWLGRPGDERSPGGVSGIAAPAVFALAVLLKSLTLAAVPALLRHRRCRTTLLFAGGLLLGLTVPYFLRYPAEWAAFVHLNFAPPVLGFDSGNFGLLYLGHLVAADLALPWSPTAAALTTLFHPALLLATALVVLLSRSDDLWIGASTLVLAHFASYVHVWEHHMSAAVPLAALMLCSAFAGGAGRTDPWVWLVAACAISLALPTPFVLIDRVLDPSIADPSPGWSPLQRYALVLSKAGPLAVLYGAGLFALCRAGFRVPWRFEAGAPQSSKAARA